MDEVTVVDDIESLFRTHYGRLVRALTVVCGDKEHAADAVQEAFARAHLRWHRLRHYDDPVAWIRRVAINKLRDEHRRSTRKQRAIDRLAGERSLDAFEPTVGDSDVTAALATLPRQQRLAMALRYIEGLSVAEVAGALGVSDGAVKFHLHAGRKRLREALASSSGLDIAADQEEVT